MSPDMQYRDLGRTGEKVSVIGLGGYHLGKQADPTESVRLVRTAIDRGITFMDNCWDYSDGIVKSAWVRHCATAIAEGFPDDQDGWPNQRCL